MSRPSQPRPTPSPADPRPFAARRPAAVVAIGCVLLLLVAAVHVATGTQRLGIDEVVSALLSPTADPRHRTIVWELRLPRTLVGVTAGAMLGLAGALLQGIMRNPLAAPDLLGVTAGAVLMAAVTVTFGPSVGTLGPLLPLIALVGGLLAGGAAYGASRRHGRTDPTRLILAGVLLTGVLSSATSLVVIVGGVGVSGVLQWMIGSLNGRVWSDWRVIWPWAAVTIPAALASSRVANLLQLGDDSATAAGLRVERARLGLLGLAALLTAGAVSVVGAVAFVGLIAPHTVRRVAGSDSRRVLPLSTLCGAGLLLSADTVAGALVVELPFDTLSPPALLPVGVLTALLGAGFFFLVLRRGSR